MHRFIAITQLEPEHEIVLSAEESHHLTHVLRLEVGASVVLLNGRGDLALAKITEVSARASRCFVETVTHHSVRSRIRLCFGMTKPAALEFILRRCTELGIAEFQPLFTQHSFHASEWREARWTKIIHEVCKQCEETHFPALANPLKLGDWLATRHSGVRLIFCDEANRESGIPHSPSFETCDILVGSEGGWSEGERAIIQKQGAELLSLGPNRLRADTATLVALTLVKKQIGEF